MKLVAIAIVVAALGCKGKDKPTEDNTKPVETNNTKPAQGDRTPATTAEAKCADGSAPRANAELEPDVMQRCVAWKLGDQTVAVELAPTADDMVVLKVNGAEVARYSLNMARSSTVTLGFDGPKMTVVAISEAGSQDEGDATAELYEWDAASGKPKKADSWSGSALDDPPAWATRAASAGSASADAQPSAGVPKNPGKICDICNFLDKCSVMEAELFGTSQASCPDECTDESRRPFFECLNQATDCASFKKQVEACQSKL